MEHGVNCRITGVNWDFGDGGTVTGGNTTNLLHTYSLPGSYFVSVQIIVGTLPDTCHIWRYSQVNATGCVPENCGPCQIWQPGSIYVTNTMSPCSRRFDVLPGGISQDCPNVTYTINFGDGMNLANQSSISNVVHTFPGNGTYDVCVKETRTVGNYSCSTTYCDRVKISGCLVCAPCPIANPANLNVFFAPFNPCKVGVTASPFNGCGDIDYSVDFGDGTVLPYVGTLLQHTYATPGTWTITLTETHFDGVNTCSSTTSYVHDVPDECRGDNMREGAEEWMMSTDQQAAMMVIPNAMKAGGTCLLKWAEGTHIDQVKLLDTQGRVVLETAVSGQGQQQLKIPVSLPSGLYFLLADDGLNGVTKLLVE
ncbi:MAG: PKD domain-containing protein [Bacteroidia bacterium]